MEAWRARNIAVANASNCIAREIARQIVGEQTTQSTKLLPMRARRRYVVDRPAGTAAYNVERCGIGAGICSGRGRYFSAAMAVIIR